MWGVGESCRSNGTCLHYSERDVARYLLHQAIALVHTGRCVAPFESTGVQSRPLLLVQFHIHGNNAWSEGSIAAAVILDGLAPYGTLFALLSLLFRTRPLPDSDSSRHACRRYKAAKLKGWREIVVVRRRAPTVRPALELSADSDAVRLNCCRRVLVSRLFPPEW